MKKGHLEILTNIIGAVESGGQVYGNRRYDAYAGAGANSTNEKTCTLGWAQNYGNEGRKLCKMILQTDPVSFRNADTAAIEGRLLIDWVAANWNPSASEKEALIAIITTDAGKKCQDELFQELMEQYINEAEAYGVTGIEAQMMWCEIEHLGGPGPVKRIFGRAVKPYTPDSVLASLIKDQNDAGNDNQVGDKKFQRRHECCVKWIKQYVVNEEEVTTMGKTAQDYLNVWRGWIAFSEANGKFKQIIDLYNSYRPLPRGYAVRYSDEWCDTTVSAAAIAADVVDLIGRECGCEEHVKIFKALGIWNEDGTITPEPGYIILYNWDQRTQPNDGYSDHIGVVESVSNGQLTCIEGNNGEAVARRVLSVGNGYIRGYASPKFSKTGSTGPATPEPPTPSGSGDISKTVAWYGVVNTSTLNVRSWAGSDNAQLKSYPSISQGTKVGVCETVNDKDGDPWYYIKIDGAQGEKYGFVAAMYITKQASSTPAPDTPVSNPGAISKTPQWTGRVTADVLNVRSWAGVNNPTIKSWPQLSNGNMVDVCDTVTAVDGSPWYYIRIAGTIFGFVHSAYIERT